MGIVTDVSEQKKRKNRVNIYIDGEFVCGMDAFAALKQGIRIGREISDKELERAQVVSDGETAFAAAAKLIGVRSRSKNEIVRSLKNKGYSDYVIGNVINKLERYNYINDEAFVGEYIGSVKKSRSRRRIKADLMRMGVDEALAGEKLEGLEGQEDAAKLAGAKYLRSHPFDKNKLGAHLQYKGFDWETIRTVVDLYIRENNASENGGSATVIDLYIRENNADENDGNIDE